MSDCVSTPYDRKTNPFSRLTGKYARKASPFSNKAKPYSRISGYSKVLICPFLLAEDGFPLLQEENDKILLE